MISSQEFFRPRTRRTRTSSGSKFYLKRMGRDTAGSCKDRELPEAMALRLMYIDRLSSGLLLRMETVMVKDGERIVCRI